MIALQVRGGPEPYMVTSWLQILKLRPGDIGTYTCTVANIKGIVKASAGVNVNQVSPLSPPLPPPFPPPHPESLLTRVDLNN